MQSAGVNTLDRFSRLDSMDCWRKPASECAPKLTRTLENVMGSCSRTHFMSRVLPAPAGIAISVFVPAAVRAAKRPMPRIVSTVGTTT